MRATTLITVLAILMVFAASSDAVVVWMDTFDDTGNPGTDYSWLTPWPAWTSVGIGYYEGTTQTLVQGQYVCGSACLTPSGSSEYSYFGSFYFPASNPAVAAMFSSGIAFGSEDGYFCVADQGSNSVHIFDQQEGIGQTWVATGIYALQQEVWYNYRSEADLSGSIPWIRIKVWEVSEIEPVYWNAEGWGVENHTGQYIIVHGGDYSSTGKVWFDNVGVESQIAPRAVIDLDAAAMGSDISLTWTNPTTADSISLYQGTTAYFPPVPGSETSGIVSGTHTDSGAAGDEGTNHFYLVRGINESGEGMVSNRVGEFDFSLGGS